MTDAERDKRLIVESFKAAFDILQGLDMAVNDCYVPADRAMQRKVQDKLAEAWNNLGVVRFRRGDYPAAREAFEKAVALDADYGEAWYNLRDTYEELGLKAERAKAAARVRELGAEDED